MTGYPYLKVVSEEWSADGKQVTVALEQARFLSDGSASEETALWSIPLLFATAGSVSQEAVIMTQKVQTFTIPVAGGPGSRSWLKINAGQKALVRVAHSADMIDRLKEAMQADKNAVAAVDKAALLLDAYALAKAGLAPLETVVAIVRALEGESESSIVWSALAGVLGGLHLLMEQLGGDTGAAAFKGFVAFGKKFVVTALEKVNIK